MERLSTELLARILYYGGSVFDVSVTSMDVFRILVDPRRVNLERRVRRHLVQYRDIWGTARCAYKMFDSMPDFDLVNGNGFLSDFLTRVDEITEELRDLEDEVNVQLEFYEARLALISQRYSLVDE